MVDIDGILTTEEGIKQLTQKQREEFEELSALYPNKRPLDTAFDKADINRVVADYLKYVEFNILPSIVSDLSIKDASVSRIKEKLYSGEVLNGQSYDWNVYSSESKEILQPITEEIKLNNQGNNVGSNDTISDTDSKPCQKQTIEHRMEGDFSPDSVVDKGIKFARGLGGHIKKGGLRVIKFIRENPELVFATLGAIESVVANFINSMMININEKNKNIRLVVFNSYEITNSFDNIIEENAHSDFVTSSIIDEAIPCHREVHADKHIRKLPNGWKPSPEKIATAKENGFDLGPGETWVESY